MVQHQTKHYPEAVALTFNLIPLVYTALIHYINFVCHASHMAGKTHIVISNIELAIKLKRFEVILYYLTKLYTDLKPATSITYFKLHIPRSKVIQDLKNLEQDKDKHMHINTNSAYSEIKERNLKV